MNVSVVRTDKETLVPRAVSLDEARDKLEGHGYWTPGTIAGLLEDGQPFTLYTPWAWFEFDPQPESNL